MRIKKMYAKIIIHIIFAKCSSNTDCNIFYITSNSFRMKVLKKGDNGDEVMFLQRLLLKAKLLMSADGDFGSKTDAAVRQFQKDNKL